MINLKLWGGGGRAWGANVVYYGRCKSGEYCIRGKELGSILLRHRIKKISGFNLASTRFRIHRAFKISTLDSGLKMSRIRMPGFTGYVWTWKFFNPERKRR